LLGSTVGYQSDIWASGYVSFKFFQLSVIEGTAVVHLRLCSTTMQYK